MTIPHKTLEAVQHVCGRLKPMLRLQLASSVVYTGYANKHCSVPGMGQLHCSQLQLNYNYITFYQLQLQAITLRPIIITK